jgi:hypothetical protein
VADARLTVARVRMAQGQAAEALALVQQSEPAVLAAVGEQAPVLARARLIRGKALLGLGRAADAVPVLESALEIAERSLLDPAENREIRLVLQRAKAKSAGHPHVSAATP